MTEHFSINDVCARLRAIRQAQSLSLADVEARSGGTLKAVVLGSYERGARTLSVRRAMEIADIYHIPVSELFQPATKTRQPLTHTRYIIDLRTLRKITDAIPQSRESHVCLFRYCREIQRRRNDWNGEVLSLRSTDIETLSIAQDMTVSGFCEELNNSNILLQRTI